MNEYVIIILSSYLLRDRNDQPHLTGEETERKEVKSCLGSHRESVAESRFEPKSD